MENKNQKGFAMVVDAIEKIGADHNHQIVAYLGSIAMSLAVIADSLQKEDEDGV